MSKDIEQDEVDINNDWMQKESKYSKRIKFQNGIYRSVTDFGRIFGGEILLKEFYFSFRFVNMRVLSGIGVVDIEYKKQKWGYGQCQMNKIVIYSDGSIYHGLEKDGLGSCYKEGDVVTVLGDRGNGTLGFYYNSCLVKIVKSEILKSQGVKWVPWVYLNNQGDCVELIESWTDRGQWRYFWYMGFMGLMMIQ